MLVKSKEVQQIQRVYQVRQRFPERRGRIGKYKNTASVSIPCKLRNQKPDKIHFSVENGSPGQNTSIKMIEETCRP